MLDIVLAGMCLALLALSGFLMLRLFQRRKKYAEMKKDLTLQRSRVLARKEKIWELRKKMSDLTERLREDEQKLLNSYTQEEIGALYPDIISGLRQLLKTFEVSRLPQAKQTNVMAAAIKLSHLLQNAFRVTEEPLLTDEETEEKEPVNDGLAPRRVLVVDDNEEIRRFCAEIIENSGFLVDLAANGEEAVDKVRMSREGYYDLILMDVIMPGKNGYEACREIRMLMRTDCERIPVIALTANNFSEDYVQLIDAGMNDRISKPISRESFLSIVDKWLKRQAVDEASNDIAEAWSSIQSSDGSAAMAK